LLPKNEPQQRICVTFSRGEGLKYVSHLDLMRLWHRAFRRAGMPLSYSQGFNPQARISIAAPLAVGVTSDGELMDVFFDRKVSLEFLAKAMRQQLPVGVQILAVKEVWSRLPSLQSQLRFAEYRVEVESDEETGEVSRMIRDLLDRESLPWQHARGEKVHRYDLRQLTDDIWIIDAGQSLFTLGMRLVNDSRGSGRPEQVTLALGFSALPRSIHRTRLIVGAN